MYGNGRPGPTASGVRTGKMRAVEHGGELAALRRRDLGDGHARRCPRPRSSRQQLGEQRALALDQLAHARADAVEHLGGQQVAGRARPVGRVAHGLEQLGHAHHAELVEVGREDRREAQALEQRDALVAGELEHAGVPLEPRQLAVEEARLLGGLLRAGGRPSDASCDQCECTRAQEPAQLAALAGDRLDRGRAGLGKRDARARDGVDERREIGLVADEHEIVAVALGQAGEIVGLDAEQRRSRRPAARRSSSAMISAVSWARGYGLVTTHCGSTLQRRQRAARGARGAAPRGHERTLGIGRAERAILGLSVSDEDDCHGRQHRPAARTREPRSRLVTASSPIRSPFGAAAASNGVSLRYCRG